MVFQTKTCTLPECDECGQGFEGEYVHHYDSEAEAIEDVTDEDWIVVGKKLYCDRCYKGQGFPCAGCDDLVECEGDRCRECRRQEAS